MLAWDSAPGLSTARHYRDRDRRSMAKHSLGKGEVVSSILTGSTSKTKQTKNFLARALPFPLALEREQSVFPPAKLGENLGNLFGRRSLILSSTVLTPIRDRAARNSQPFCTRGWRKRDDQKVCRKAECRNNSATRDENPSATPEAVKCQNRSSVQRRARFDVRRRV
jgi:hypothetical protein